MLDLIIQLASCHSDDVKASIETILKEGYLAVSELRSRSFNKTLNVENIEKVKSFFNSNKFNVDEIIIADKYLKKYIHCLSKFWENHSYYQRQISRGKYDLFEAMKEKDIHIKGYSDTECARVLRKMEDCWVASNQVYTKFLINLINKEFMR